MESPEIEELTLCGYCKKKFNDTDQSPKLLSCKHYFCLQCMRTNLNKGNAELYCVYCWKKTDLGELGPESLPTHNPVLCLTKNFSQLKLFSNNPTAAAGTEKTTKVISENCHTHAMPLALWCTTCGSPVCRACATTSDHSNHQIKSQIEAKDQLIAELQVDLASMSKMLSEIQRLASQQREFLLKVLEACVTLKTHVEADLTNNVAHFEVTETRENLAKLRLNLSMAETLTDVHSLCASVNLEKQRFQMRYQEMYLQCQLDDIIRNSTVILDFPLLKQALSNLHNGDVAIPGNSRAHARENAPQQRLRLPQPQLCASAGTSQLHEPSAATPTPGAASAEKHLSRQQHNNPEPGSLAANEEPGEHVPPVLLQRRRQRSTTRSDSDRGPSGRCPKMAKNFGVLTTGEAGMGYKGCQIFQCWEGESVITGDFELNNGRGGRSIFEDSYFLPDDTKLLAVRGTVGMRRTQKRHDNLGMVGSQFRIILQEMRGFTGIFGHVVEGLELVEKISTYGDTAGKPTKNILIAKCGKL
ncbi:hypothetical protein WA026_000170 [Henosepilachna vigintioctopunctata]|uniref:Peptidyl-prolyl cis-trans isomerase n=1 Tax=Henosepilachna vigintioctopunctata TaxID=420089 RepID=A0AAW1UWQ4_9CUCU